MTELERVVRELLAPLVREEVERAVAALRMQSDEDGLLSTAAAARIAAVAPATIRRWVREGKLVGHRSALVTRNRLRVRRADLEKLLAGECDASELSPEQLAVPRFRVNQGPRGAPRDHNSRDSVA